MKKKKIISLIKHIVLLVLADALLLGIVLLGFAFMHHGKAYLEARYANRDKHSLAQTTPAPTTTIEVTTPGETNPNTPQNTTVIVDNRTPWQIKYADKFTDEIVVTENSYTSPNISIHIDTVHYGEGWTAVTYYVADIYVGSIDCFKTYTAHNEFRYGSTQTVERMSRDSGAIIGMSGDYYSIQNRSFIVRNSYEYMTMKPYNTDICVMYSDGSIENYGFYEYEVDDILAKKPLQVWSFGPSLLDSEGKAKTKFNVKETLDNHHQPRSALGYYEPGHYCFVVVDGREKGHSVGMYLAELAQLFEELGCTSAYNMDGGGSASLTFQGEYFSKPSEVRSIGDILLIAEP